MDSNKLFRIVFITSTMLVFQSNLALYLEFGQYVKVMNDVYSPESIYELRERFDRNYTYQELVEWVRDKLIFDNSNQKFPRYVGPLNVLLYGKSVPQKILKGGIGRCEEFSVVYVAICVAHGYDARLVISRPPGDHAWAEVMIDGRWIHVDPSDGVIDDPLRYHRANYTLVRIMAYEPDGYEEVTKIYIS